MIPITLTQQMHTPNLKIIEWFFPDNGRKCRTNGRRDTQNHCSPSLCPLPTSSARTINVTMFNKRFLSPTDQKCVVSSMFFYYCSHNRVRGISSEILLGQWHPAGATPHHAKPILCLWLEIWALHQVLLTSMQHGFLSRPPVKNGLDAVCTDVVRWLHTSELGFRSCG